MDWYKKQEKEELIEEIKKIRVEEKHVNIVNKFYLIKYNE
jgi:hypothetical protein